MPNKAQEYVELADDTARKLSGDYRGWTDFLTTSARLYKYNYYDQLLIYAQRPDATACAEFDLWNNTMHRYIRKGTKGIALITPTPYGPRLRYVFDVSDTGERHNSLSVNPWVLREEHLSSVSDMLEDRFDALASLGLAAQLEQIAQRKALDYWREHRRDIIDSVADTFMQGYDDFSIGASFRKLAANSLQFTLESRCGLEPEAEREDFADIFNWNTPVALMELGTAINTISSTVLRQIEATIKSYERSHENERADLHPEGRLPVPELDSDRSGQDRHPAGQVRTDASRLSEGEPSWPVQPAAPDWEADAAPAGDREDRTDEDGSPDDEPEEAVQRDGGTEGEGSDELGSADEQSAAPGGRDDSLGTDLQLTPEEQSRLMRLSEQMSFIVPSESEQIELIDILEAESVQTPFAFSVPQEVVDEVLRQGGNTTDLRLIIANDFMKQMPVTTIAERMQRLYHGGNGLVINGRQYSAWYEDSGIRIANGKYARNVHMSQLLTWEDAAKRIGDLMESGQYLSMLELASAPIHERKRLAESLWYMSRDMASEAEEYMPTLKALRGGGFPEETARLANALTDPDFVSLLTDEARTFTDAYRQNHDLMRFRFYTPEFMVPALNELVMPRRTYDSLLTEVARVQTFITEDEIDATITGGSSVAGGKGRIYQYFTAFPPHSTKERADFLKNEYGIGGRSHAVSGSDHSGENHDSKGIQLQKADAPQVLLTWPQVSSRVETLIRKDLYLTEKEKEVLQLREAEERVAEMPTPDEPDEEEQDFTPEDVPDEVLEAEETADEPIAEPISEPVTSQIESTEPHTYDVGDTVYLDGTAFLIEEKTPFGVQLRDPTLVYPVLRAESIERFERLLAQDERNNNLLPVHESTETPDEELHLRSIVIDLTATAEEERVPEPPAPTAENFHITDDHLGEGGAKAKFQANMNAIHLLKQLEAEQRPATHDEQEVLSRYVGWGGLADAFDETKPNWSDEYAELSAALTPEEYSAARGSTLNAHYTSPIVIRAIYDAVEQMGFHTGNVLEPSCGVGNFFGMLPDSMSESRLYGVELDSITGRIAQKLYPKADITVAGFETTDKKDFFDLAIGNVPFGSYKVQDRAFDKYNFLIHDYFFAKTLDQVRPGGVVAFITSKGTMDKQNPEVRKYIAQRAELLGAIRLPNTAFKANAGTEVTSDIIFLQKREQPIAIEPDWVHLGQTEDGLPINSYFAEHPEMVLGTMVWDNRMYGNQTETACVPIEGADLSEQLREAVTHISGQYQEAEPPELNENEAIRNTIPADPNVKNYSYTVVDGDVYYRTNSIMIQPDLNPTAKERAKGLVELRNCVNELIQAQLDNADDDEIHAIQRKLDKLYDSYTARFGLINSRGNANVFSEDASYYLLCSLEVINEQGELTRKADMFTKRTIRQHQVAEHVDTATEALAISIAEKAKVDLDYMEQLTGIPKDEITQQLTGVIFPVPNGQTHTPLFESYVTADEYLSGNVRQKLRDAIAAAEINPLYEPNVHALEAAQPKDLDASEIDVRLGATWVDKETIADFMYETFGTPMYLQRYLTVNFSPYTAEWNIDGKTMISSSNVAAYVTYGTDRANAYRILEDTLNLRDVRIYDTIEDADGKERRVLNQKETTLAQQKQQAIKDAYRDWIWKDPYRRDRLVTRYNELFNSIRPREYDGQHIAFAGMTPEISLREHQRNAVAHILYGGNTLLAHEVGAGKTFEMVAAAMESKRLGLCQKPLFVVPNHLTEQWASEFLRLYPSSNILVATKKDFEKANRQKFCARIATGDYDAVIIGHSQFERIPVSQERQQRMLQNQIDEITDGISELKHHRGEQFSIKQLERTRRQLENKLQKLEAAEKKDHVVTFEQLGVDRLFVDEGHAFKNLFLFTKMRNVAGLSSAESQKSSDMFLKCQYMDEITGGRGTVFATGTPVSNSMTELYTMQRYLQYKTLKEKGMVHFDAWASTFGETTTAIELAPEGTGYRARTRFAKFFNLPELMTLFKEVADIKTADQLHLPTPDAHYETIVVKPSEHQQEMVAKLSERAALVHSGSIDPSEDNMLKITSDGRKLGLDQRLINPLLPDDPGSKVNACVNNILRIYRDGQADKLTQLVFCDLSTPRGKSSDGKEQPSDILTPEETGNGNFNIYDDIRSKLIAQGIPAEQIAFIHEANTEVRKKELFAKVRSGQVRVLMGSTAKMGAGMNVQDRLVALHDLDCPWRPGDLEQRAGRIVRQGNQNKDVFIYRYVTEATFDAYLWQTVENKQKFISQIMTSKSPVRSCDDVDETALSYAEIKALCAGDPRIKEKMDLDVDVARLRLMKADHQSKQYRLEDQLLKYFPQQIEQDQRIIAGINQDIATVASHPLPEEGFVGMTIHGRFITDKEEAGKAILEECKTASFGKSPEIGSYRGLSMQIEYDTFENKFRLLMHGAFTHRVDIGNSADGNIIRIENALAQMQKKVENAHDHLVSMEQQMAVAKEEIGKPFPQEDELRTKSGRLAELDAELNMDQHNMQEAHEVEAEDKPSVLEGLKEPCHYGEHRTPTDYSR